MVDQLQLEELKEIVKSLCSTLKCAVCLGPLQKDTLTCVNGHCICTKCQGTQGLCPTCREAFSNVKQNSLVRQVLDITPHNCQYNNCSYLVKSGDDHESYCCYKPTPCKFCDLEVPAVDLGDHIRNKHSDKVIFSEKNARVRTYNVDCEHPWDVLSFHSSFNHFLWQVQNFSPTTGVLKIIFIPVLCGKPTHDIYVKVSFKSEKTDYEAGTKVKINVKKSPAEEDFVLIPISVVQKCVDKEKKEFVFIVNISKTKE